MTTQLIRGNKQIMPDTIGREELNDTVSGEAVIKKLIPGSGVMLSSTGIDSGTGDVTITVSGGSGGYTQEEIEDFVGAMVTGNTETGISVTYDDALAKLNFDAQTAGDARYEKIATTSVAAPDTVDITTTISNSTSRNIYKVDLSGLTADRTLTITSGSAGSVLEIYITAGHATYHLNITPKAAGAGSCTLHGSTATWDYYLQREKDSVVLVSTSNGNWEVLGTYRVNGVDDSITDAVTFRAPSQNAVFDALVLKEDLSNKSTNVNTDQASHTKYPSVRAVYDWAVGLFVQKNSAVTSATKTKITYDIKGLVTAGADATTADIADSTNKRYVTDAQLTVIGNTSGTNTGDSASIPIGYLDTDGTLAANSDVKVASQKAVRTYVAANAGGVGTGWTSAGVTWTRTGNFTFTITGDVTATYRKGTKVRYKDGGAYEYGVVVASAYSAPDTTVTLLTNADYAMAATTITDNYYSFIQNPEGFPDWFNWTVTATGFSGTPTGNGLIKIDADTAYVHVRVDGTSNATTFTVTSLPVAPNMGFDLAAINGVTIDGGTTQTTPGRATITDGTTTITFRSNTASGAWSNSLNKRAQTFIFYKY